jgi:cap2 methyltransferase
MYSFKLNLNSKFVNVEPYLSKLTLLKSNLNKVKSRFDNLGEKQVKKWSYVRNQLYMYSKLSNKVKELTGEKYITNAWLKMREILIHFDLLKNDMTTFHVCEAPGSFILATLYYVKQYDIKNYKWFAESHIQINTDKSNNYLGDEFKMMRLYPDNWKFGIKGDGDISNFDNIKSFHKEIGKVDLVTGDCGLDLTGNYDGVEDVMHKIILGNILTCLLMLKIGGHCVIKMFTTFEAKTLNLIYLVASHFKEMFIAKPVTSRPANSEIYLIGINLTKNVTDLNVNYITNNLPKSFLEDMLKVTENLTKLQSLELTNVFDFYDKYDDMTSNEELIDKLNSSRSKLEQEWILKMKIKSN